MDSDYSYEAEREEEGKNIDYDSCDEEQASTSSVKLTNEYGDPLYYDHVKAGMWVVVLYEEKMFIGKVQYKQGDEVNVRCLALPFGINIPQEFEPGEGIFYDKVYKTDITPMQTQMDKDGKQKRKWFWVY